MNYLKFDKEQLINLEYSLDKEVLRSNRAGSYMSTTLNGCNTRKYHGLLVSPIQNFGGEKHVLLSSLDETVIQNNAEFNLGIHRYKGGAYEPKGHKYIRNVEFNRIPKITYRVGGVILSKERLLVEKEETVLIRYTLEDAHTPTKLRFKPFLAFRNIHQLSKANMFANSKFNKAKHGISIKLYEGYPELFMQFSKKPEFIPVPDWYYNIEYLEELKRGYEYLEDLFVPGYFEIPINKGESIVFAAGLNETKTVSLKQRFTKEVNKRPGRDTFLTSLDNAAEQFIMHKQNETDIIAGFPWYESITRQTFISLPGLCISLNDAYNCRQILDTYIKYLKGGFFPDHIHSPKPVYHSADSSLWFIWAVQQYFKQNPQPNEVWKKYGKAIEEILEGYKKPTSNHIHLTREGLIYAQKENTALTWMDSYVDGKPVVQRAGFPVEVNALWFNALCFSIDLADLAGHYNFVEKWKSWVEKAGKAFLNTFLNQDHEHLADVVNNGIADWSVRPNMVIAAAMDYSPLSTEQKKSLLSVAKKKLLTSRGLRSLSPDHLRYKGIVDGGPREREMAMHQGAVHPWLIQFFAEGYLKIHKKGGLPFVKQIMENFEDDITEHCIGTMAEIYDGNPPHKARGAISMAWSVAGVVQATHLVENYKE
ncbi:MAG: glycogen debranching enzyme family protein [Prolixibacteraceae bacterium]|nr:glycogen debranching enzyme family protein [Prolixibacteraceae bacterium]